MPKPCKLQEIAGAMWAKLDIDYDGGPVSLYTPLEIEAIKNQVRKDVIYMLQNWDRIVYEDD